MTQTGVYSIRNTTNGKVYVGSAAVSFRVRWNSHRHALRNGKHANRHLQAAWTKYGEYCFEFVILSRCKPANCVTLEQLWIDRLRATNRKYGYNLYQYARSPLGLKRPESVGKAVAEANRRRVVTEETRARMSASRKARQPRRPKVSKPHWSKSDRAEEIKQRISRLGSKHTAEARAKMSATHKRRFSNED